MPNWYWEERDLRNTPSRAKGLDTGTETRYRREGVRFIMELGKALNLSHLTMATASVYFQRFYMFQTFQDFPRYPMATCCLFLAGKSEETPKKCRDIIRTTRQLTNNRIFETFGVDPKEEIMALERVLLQTIHFDLQVDHPYHYLLLYGKSLKGDKNKIEKVVQMSWTFINDSLCTKTCLKWEPEVVAVSVMYMAMKLMKFEVKDWTERQPHQKVWWDQFVEGLETTDCEDICHQLLDLYAQPSKLTRDCQESPPPLPQTGPSPLSGKGLLSRSSKVPSKKSTPSSANPQPHSSAPTKPKSPTVSKSRSSTPPPPPPSLAPSTPIGVKPPPPPGPPATAPGVPYHPGYVVPPPPATPQAVVPPIPHAYAGYPPLPTPHPLPPVLTPPTVGYPHYPPAPPYYPPTQGYFPPGLPAPGHPPPPGLPVPNPPGIPAAHPFPPNAPPPTGYLRNQPPPPPPMNNRSHLRY